MSDSEFVIPVPDLARDFWARISKTFHTALNFDPQWYIENDHSITWWPNFLSQSIEAETFFMAGENPNTDITVRVTITTPVCLYSDQEWAENVCHGENTFLPYGAFVARDGLLKLTGSVVVSPLNFEMTQLLHEMALVHIASATKLSYYVTDANIEGVTVAASEHPESGPRAIPDELARLFLPDDIERSDLFGNEMEDVLRSTLPRVKAWFLANGYTEGWEDEDVFFVDHANLNHGIGIGFPLVKEFPEKYGPGLQIMASVLKGVAVQDMRDWCNDLNFKILENQNSSQIGPIYGVLDSGALNIRNYLGAFYLRKRIDSSYEALVAAITNAMIHMSAAVMRLNDEIGITPKQID
jgi:hypothetical protein